MNFEVWLRLVVVLNYGFFSRRGERGLTFVKDGEEEKDGDIRIEMDSKDDPVRKILCNYLYMCLFEPISHQFSQCFARISQSAMSTFSHRSPFFAAPLFFPRRRLHCNFPPRPSIFVDIFPKVTPRYFFTAAGKQYPFKRLQISYTRLRAASYCK